ncbi:MAG: hypothetical protein ACFFD4_11745 [Candidatus Odinarchaeota archaeon]
MLSRRSKSIYRVRFRDRLGVRYNEFRQAQDTSSLKDELTQEGCYVEKIEKVR